MTRELTQIRNLAVVFLGISLLACTEPFEVESNDFENILVIDATITDEAEIQEVFLSRTYPTDGEKVLERGAEVQISDGIENFNFFEEEDGVYRSTIPFAAQPDRDYVLSITTSDGNGFISTTQQLPSAAEIREIRAVRAFNEAGDDGVSILVDGGAENNESGYYRYEYEETYRIVSFYNPSQDLVIVSENPPELELVDKTREEQICYVTDTSRNIRIATSENLQENRVENVQVRFIKRTSRQVAHRYSILVKQLAQTKDAYDFYKTLEDFSGIETIFSQTQPGFILGNIESVDNNSQKVLGIFEVATYTEKRLFFNFEDVFDSSDIRFLEGGCESNGFSLDNPDLFEAIKSGRFKYTNEEPPFIYNIAPIECVDCNELGTNIIPPFWEE